MDRAIASGGGIARVTGLRRLTNFGRAIPASPAATGGVLGFFFGGNAVIQANHSRSCNIDKAVKALAENNKIGVFTIAENITEKVLVYGGRVLMVPVTVLGKPVFFVGKLFFRGTGES